MPEDSSHVDRGIAAYQARDLVAAESAFRAAMAETPDVPLPRLLLGNVLRDVERDDEARVLLEPLVDLPELGPPAHNSLGLIALRAGDDPLAESHFRAAMAQAYQFPAPHYNLGLMKLRQGQYLEGFKEYEWRWYTDEFTRFQCLQPRWNGRPLDGTLLVHTEQGHGDVFQFCRFLPLVRERCRRMILVCSERLSCMFSRPETADEIVFPGAIRNDSFDAYLPLMSAPHVLGTELDTIPCDIPYLHPEPRTISLGASHVPDARLKVGLVWGGSPTHVQDRHRSCPLEQFLPLLDIPQIAFYSLQKGPQRDQMARLPRHQDRLRDLDDFQADFADTTAMARQLDLIISIDTSVVHMGGAVGIPTWCLLCTRSDWRWLKDRDDTPWYPTVRLFRQRVLDDWEELFTRVAAALRDLLASRS